jgi:hypothetical protein
MKILRLFGLCLILACSLNVEAKIHRSATARTEFKQQQPCPATGKTKGACPGYVIDHVIPLACGGLDAPANMQWQTKAEAAEKDKWERIGCEQQRKRNPRNVPTNSPATP